jgi:DNA-binding IclR family transcriptional regulator
MTMILSQLNQYLAANRRAALADLSQHFGAAPEALRGMLGVLERKGRVRKLPAGTACGGGCTRCEPASVELYEWVGE